MPSASDRNEQIRGQNLEQLMRVPLAAQTAGAADVTTVALYDGRGNDPSGDTALQQELQIEILAAYFTPLAVITGAATNFASVQLVELDATGAYVGTLASLDFTNGVNATANGPVALPVKTGSQTVVPTGHQVAVRQHQSGTGLALPAGSLQLQFARQGIS